MAERILSISGFNNDTELSILLVNDLQIQKLNKKYRNIDKPTDVLAFAFQDGEFNNINRYLLGDIVISLETARRQAIKEGHDLFKEIRFLVTHGILHLSGYDHEKSLKDARIMRKKSEEVLNILETEE
ncbi:MAG: rRNA maturation RNase YbeY [Nitrospirota bacterium]